MSLKILMATMSLDIGGAETHIIELSKELKRRGCDIAIASNGGAFVSELEQCGIRHIKIPLHVKNPVYVIKAYNALYKLLSTEHFDVVHAHARIPGFICGMVCKRLKIRFMTSTHGVFAVTPYWKLITNWGERSLAVSFDIKQYLISNYRIPSDNITVTINGIDTGKFSPDTPYDDIASECMLEPSEHRIIYVSRIDRESAHVGFQLIEAAPLLNMKYDDLEIVMVGGGTALSDLKTQARTVNRLLGRDVIKVIGPRAGDINKFFACGHISVGVSRSALEGMASGKPTILAGSQGYIGIFGPDKLGDALDTNFCCRGCGKSNSKQLANDIITLMSMPESELKAQGEYNRSIVIKYYSIVRMADDALYVYSKLTPYEYYKYGDVVLSGYYGFGNMGDDSLLQLIIDTLHKHDPDMKITVLSKNPRLTSKLYGVRSINRFNIFAVRDAMRRAKLLINGGGSLLQNSTSNRSLYYYIAIMRMAKKYGLKLMLYASGIGPLIGYKYKKMSRDILNEADIITLREKSSFNELQNLGVINPNVSITADPAFSLVPSEPDWVKYILNREGFDKFNSVKYFAVSLRTRSGIDNEFINKMVAAVKLISFRYRMTPVFVPLQAQQDYEVCRKAAIETDGKLLSDYSASELAGIMKHMQFVICSRLHLLIYAASVGTPVIGVLCDPKIDAQLDTLEQPYKVPLKDFDASILLEMVDDVLENHDSISTGLIEKTAYLRSFSDVDAQHVIDLLNK